VEVGDPRRKSITESKRVMDFQKKPCLILQLKSIIQSEKLRSLLPRDLEKQVGFVQKWSFMAIIEKYPSIFRVDGGNRTPPPSVRLTDKAQKIANEEAEARKLMEPIMVKNLRKMLMLSVDCRVPLKKIKLIESELGLPNDFKKSFIPKYPEFFTVKDFDGNAYLHLENWDSSLAVTTREERLACEGVMHSSVVRGKVRISKDGNYQGPYAFTMDFPAGFRPNMSYLEELEKMQGDLKLKIQKLGNGWWQSSMSSSV
jgi:hypothetical protein